jgi:hypothetical protein
MPVIRWEAKVRPADSRFKTPLIPCAHVPDGAVIGGAAPGLWYRADNLKPRPAWALVPYDVRTQSPKQEGILIVHDRDRQIEVKIPISHWPATGDPGDVDDDTGAT